MSTYIVFYFSRSQEKEYFEGKLFTAVMGKYGEENCLLMSHGLFLVTDESPVEIRDFFARNAYPRDGFLVVKSGIHSAWSNINKDWEEWLKEKL